MGDGDMNVHGDLFDVLPTLPAASVDACVTDPPYGLGFMGKQWDTFKPSERPIETVNKLVTSDHPNLKGRKRSPGTSASGVEYDRSLNGQREFQTWCERWAREVFRVLKPGAYLVAFGAPRSSHRMICGIEDAGFEIRDCLSWLFGQGFPKSLNLGDGRGTALKPGWEPAVLARKPLSGTVAANVAEFGTGTLNIDDSRIAGMKPDVRAVTKSTEAQIFQTKSGTHNGEMTDVGRWPANVCLDEQAAAMLDEQSGELVSGGYPAQGAQFGMNGGERKQLGYRIEMDNGGASRFFYVAKPSRSEREEGIYDLEPRQQDERRKEGQPGGNNPRNRGLLKRGNFHPTVKPVELMRWIVRLVTPVDGTVIDPFMGSGTTGMACAYELRSFIGIEREADYIQIAERRIASVAPLFQEAR